MFKVDSRAAAQRIMARLPVAIVAFLLGGTYILFITFVTIKQVLIVHHEYGRFLLQFVVYHTLLILSVASFVAAVSHRPIAPDQDLAPHDARPLRPDEVRQPLPVGPPATTVTGMDEDDIPLRLLRNGRSPQPGGDDADGEHSAGRRGSAGHRSPKRRGSGAQGADGDDHFDGDRDDEEDDALLPKGPDPEATLMAKGATGGPRWCRKCDGWKPDRCHHCRSCRQCILKMDHHCPWLDNCVGFHNYKPFVLFLTYTSLLSFFGCSQAAYEVFRFFNDPIDVDINEQGAHAAAVQDEMEDLRFALRPVVFMLLAILGVAFSIAVGSLCGYHWYLALNNRTTLEEMHRSVPTALLDSPTRALLETLGDRGSRNRTPGAWRPDHILTRPERNRLREGARGINVYDIGWRRNLRSVLVGEDALPPTTWRGSLDEVLRAMWPLSRPKTRRYGAGHFFTHDPSSLQQLKTLTSELRLGLEPGVEPGAGAGGSEAGDVPPPPGAPAGPRRFDVGQVWEIGDAESDTDSDGSATLIDGIHPRRSLEWRG